MSTVLLAAGCAVAYLIAYHTYGRFLAKKLFCLQKESPTPAHTHEDGTDYVPTKKEILFGHHYTSIAGTGPIVGPAIGIIYGWVPAILWVVFGSILMGAVHDFGAVVVSMRNEGKSIGDVAAGLINRRVRIVFLLIIALLLTIVLAVFCLVIAKLFEMYPASVLSVWLQIPIAIWLGYMIYKRGKPSLPYSLMGLVLLYAAIWLGTLLPITLDFGFALTVKDQGINLTGPVALWTLLLLVYVYFASILPVTTLLQPRDYINGHQLFIVMGALALAVGLSQPPLVAPAVQWAPKGAPPMWPFLFILIACGAISGFHSLVASGTTSKQIGNEGHAKAIGYGAMLLEGMLAVLVIVAVAAGIGLLTADGQALDLAGGKAAWQARYASFGAAKGLGPKVGAFVQGAANMLHNGLHIPLVLGAAMMGVFVASFAGTTLDTATRLQRYVITELAGGLRLKPLTNRYAATVLAVVAGGALALYDGKGMGGLLLFPLFGAGNQLLAGLALLVITIYLAKTGKPIIYTFVPLVFMLFMTGWAMIYSIWEYIGDYRTKGENLHLLVIGSAVVLLEIWMVLEAVFVLRKTLVARVGGMPIGGPVEEPPETLAAPEASDESVPLDETPALDDEGESEESGLAPFVLDEPMDETPDEGWAFEKESDRPDLSDASDGSGIRDFEEEADLAADDLPADMPIEAAEPVDAEFEGAALEEAEPVIGEAEEEIPEAEAEEEREDEERPQFPE